MVITAEQVRSLREQTGAGIMDCKKALAESGADLEKAVTFLREKGLATAKKKAGRATGEGLVTSYIHAGGKVGVMVEINCETDFVAKTDDFQAFTKDVAMHIAAANPGYLTRDEVPAGNIEKEKEILANQAKESGKPEAVIARIVEGKLEKHFKENCLMEQPFIKDTDKTIEDLLKEAIAKLGENIQIKRFVRFSVGDDSEG
ncbi:Translation elongation factor Ts [hydrothermal vent metagenome]|uniref:Translation elongation factor Ts n=1 Tax=hydrothermal vent metagenome TaxID=652676 RepID=A0A3B0VQL2_9ZZZZ